jgi:hypothetical protein
LQEAGVNVDQAAVPDSSLMARAAALLRQALRADQEKQYADARQKYTAGCEYLTQVSFFCFFF